MLDAFDYISFANNARKVFRYFRRSDIKVHI
jgi:hypothetical protein